MRKFLPLLVLLLAACSGDSALPPAEPDDLGLVKVAGDGQSAPVAAEAPASGALVSYAVSDNPNLLPEPLVAKIVVDEGGSLSLMPTGPSYSLSASSPSLASAALPAGTIVTFRVIGEDCGSSFISADVPDDSALVSTFWEKPTVAKTCEMEARIVVNDVPQVAETFTATFEPGPPVIDDGEDVLARHSTRVPAGHAVFSGLRDVHGNYTDAYRVEADGWLSELGSDIASDSARTVMVTGEIAFGDTTALRIYGPDGALLMDGVAEKVYIQSDGEPSWGIGAIGRTHWTPEEWTINQ